jgi:hypothetical protein
MATRNTKFGRATQEEAGSNDISLPDQSHVGANSSGALHRRLSAHFMPDQSDVGANKREERANNAQAPEGWLLCRVHQYHCKNK